ncbi:hypothetical protein [Parapedobacter tibetensis]|uniref:hypothetical protein n=1 Tax=Parapedobacter tibetensis TaxID=2972951 RepID=UPI00214D4D5E|nr:hypothetical protein [Parapedobacter tibetensis]
MQKKTGYAFFIISMFFVFHAMAQPKPGKETIVVAFPTEYRWKSNKIPKDTKAIRGTEYTIRDGNITEAPVQTITVTTIDRRYYPMKAEGAPAEKWEYEKISCPEAMLEVVDKKIIDGRTAILYAIKSDTDDDCGSKIFLAYIVEGATALHTVELDILREHFTPEVYKQWCDSLLLSRIE